MATLDPLLWEQQPFGNPDAWTLFLGAHQLAHTLLARKAKISDLPFDDLRTETATHNLIHDELARFYGITLVDFASTDLSDEVSYYAWMLTHALTHRTLHLLAGV